jgi:hypothetical protein
MILENVEVLTAVTAVTALFDSRKCTIDTSLHLLLEEE